MSWTSSANDMSATDWGWKKVGLQPGPGKMLVPIMCTSEAAPEFLLKMISCSCTTGCASFRCSCKKFGLLCTAACGPCQTKLICENRDLSTDEICSDDDDDIDDEYLN
jgi:hypothetical protein